MTGQGGGGWGKAAPGMTPGSVRAQLVWLGTGQNEQMEGTGLGWDRAGGSLQGSQLGEHLVRAEKWLC